MKKSVLINLVFYLLLQYVYGQCEDGFIFIDEIPSSVTMWPADSCFYSTDFTALEDILSINDLNAYASPLEMGTQTWINGRFKNWVADYNFSGSGLTEPISILPESIGNWTELSYLALQWNNLSSVPESLGLLTGLSSLYISNNQLTSLPESIGNLSNLDFIDLGYNQIEAIPESFCDLGNLSYLWLFNNLLSEMPECICDLNIDWSETDGAWYPYFAIGGNYLCEDLPECIANSGHLDISLDQFIYSFMVEASQNCNENAANVSTLIHPTLRIDPAYPNPFNPLTTISYNLQQPSHIVFSVLNINGEEIDRLVDSIQDSGPRSIIWDSKDHPSGVYLFKLMVGEKTLFSKGLLLK